jgi:hypothetical protein
VGNRRQGHQQTSRGACKALTGVPRLAPKAAAPSGFLKIRLKVAISLNFHH